MPIALSPHRLTFPSPDRADADGLLAYGGDLTPERLMLAYSMGIFPWYSEESQVKPLWWSPDPRFVLWLHDFKPSKTLRLLLQKEAFRVTLDTAFEQVIRACATTPRQGQAGTWITPEMQAVYCELHRLGYAHSVEVWLAGELVGGLYGVAVNHIFCGESMFTWVSNASKVGFATLVLWLKTRGCPLIDCQVHTEHLASLGATDLHRRDFLSLLSDEKYPSLPVGSWLYG